MADTEQLWKDLGVCIGYGSWGYGVPITPNGRRVLSTSGSDIFLWSLELQDFVSKVQEPDAVLESHTDKITSVCVSSDGSLVASSSIDKTIKLWNLETQKLVATLAQRKDPIYAVSFSPDGSLLAAGGNNRYKFNKGKATTIYLWDTYDRTLVKTLLGHSLRVNLVAFSSDGKMLASGSIDKTVRIWDIVSGAQLHVLNDHKGQVSEISFTPDNRYLVVGGEGGISVWKAETGELERTFANEGVYVECFAMHPSGQIIATSGLDRIDIWDLQKGKILQSIGNSWPVSLSFSPDGSLLTVGGVLTFSVGMEQEAHDGSTLKVWQVPEMYTLPRQSPGLTASTVRHPQEEECFDPKNVEDARARIVTSIVRRQGQPEFRRQLLAAYGGKCSITKFDVPEALEAAHIVPYRGVKTNCLANGILLRADIHTLFDLYRLSICPENYMVKLSPELLDTSYKELHGLRITLPVSKDAYPSKDALRQHYDYFLNGATPTLLATPGII